MVKNRAGLVDSTFDPSYRALQHCEASSGSAFEFGLEIGLSTSVVVNGSTVVGISPGICPDEIMWTNDKEHFKAITPLAGTIEVARESVDDSDKVFAQTTGGLITWTKEIGIKVDYDSVYLAAIRNIITSDSINGFEGRLIQAYSNGGFHLRITVKNVAEGYTLREVILNVKTGNFVDLFQATDEETEFTQTFNVESSPLYELEGNVSKALGVTFDATMTTTEELIGTTLTLSADVESEYASVTKKVFYQAIDTGSADYPMATGVIIAGATNAITLPKVPMGDLKIQYMFTFDQAQILIPGSTVVLGAEDRPSEIIFTDNVITDVTADIEYTVSWGNDVTEFNLIVSDDTDTVYAQTITEEDPTTGIISITGLTPATEYKILANTVQKHTFTTLATMKKTKK